MTTNNSATGGYLDPAIIPPQPAIPALPGNLTLMQFIQTMIYGLSSFTDPTLVRPNWQIDPPKRPDVLTNWIAFGLLSNKADTNAYSWLDDTDTFNLQRMEELEITCAFYGPNGDEYAALVRDSLQLTQNLEALSSASMGLKECHDMVHVPELINERWFDRYDMSIILRREILRTYPVLYFLSAVGSVQAVVEGGPKTINWVAEP